MVLIFIIHVHSLMNVFQNLVPFGPVHGLEAFPVVLLDDQLTPHDPRVGTWKGFILS